jgi:hypothetical protein
MVNAIGETLVLGLGIAFNPIAIVTSVLIATRANPRRNGIAFVIGWIVGLAVLVVLPSLLIRAQISLPSGVQGTLDERYSLFRAALGLLLLFAAAVSIVRGPLPGDQPANPRWARLLETGGVGRVLALGAFLSIVNLRNLVLLAAAASVIGQANLRVEGMLLVVAIFVAVSTLGILFPLLVHLFGGETADRVLVTWATWLNRNMGLITGVIMALFGAILLTANVRSVLH